MSARHSVLPLLAFLFFLFCYGLNTRLVTGGDTLAHLYVAASVWGTGDFDLSEYREELTGGDGQLAYYVVEEEGKLRTIFSFFPGVLLAPAGVVLEVFGGATLTGWAWVGKALNVLLAAFAGAFLWLMLRHRTSEIFAAIIVSAFWMATPLWALSMSYLQHQPAVFFQFAALYLLTGREGNEIALGRRRLASAGLCMGLAVLARYQVALVALPLGLVLAWLLRRRLVDLACFAAGAAVPAACLLLYNLQVVGSAFDIGYVVYPWATMDAPFWKTAGGLFINPAKGLLIHSPWLVFGAIGVAHTTRALRRREAIPALWLFVAITPWPLFCLYANYTGWFGGWSWGYRFLLDVLPQLTLLAAFGAWSVWRQTTARVACGILVAAGFFVQSIGALAWDNEWHGRHDLGTMPHQDWLWQGRNTQPLWYLRRGTIYLGTRAVALRENPFTPRGFHAMEQWDARRVAWTGADGASIYLPVREYPLTLRFLPPPGVGREAPLEVTVLVNGAEAALVTVENSDWQTIVLPEIPFQHAALITIRTDRTWKEPGENGRDLAVAVELQE